MTMIPPTAKAKAEVRELEREIKQFDMRMKKIYTLDMPSDIANRERNRLDTKKYKKVDKANEIKEIGISTKEKTSLKREIMKYDSAFSTLESDRDISGTTLIKVGFSKTFNKYVKIKITKWSRLMGNVRGMSSFSGKMEIDDVIVISQKEYSRLTRGKGIRTTSFMGATQKETFKIR